MVVLMSCVSGEEGDGNGDMRVIMVYGGGYSCSMVAVRMKWVLGVELDNENGSGVRLFNEREKMHHNKESKTGKVVPFSVKAVWNDLCDDWHNVKWARLVWFSQCIPRHSFTTWVALQSKLKIQDKYMIVDHQFAQSCPFCLSQKDSHKHLFFECDYPNEVWNVFKGLGRLDHAPDSWPDLIEYLQQRPINKSVWSIIQRLILGACVYYIWQERNLRLFQEKSRPLVNLVNIIKKNITLKLNGLTIKKSRQAKLAFELWNLNGDGCKGKTVTNDLS
ncbi:uncharacterized protein [Rutidosis leptorrhynchoides]|uniref:uncharacterized protein n=1 Tax=Rutidosis leptorrhynchoides TaxID=125765 RepID=UPI003A9A0FF8